MALIVATRPSVSKDVIRSLYGLQTFGMKFGLRGITSLLHHLDDPHKRFASVHIAGTNGKGSTAAMIASILTAAGYKTGLYTSPHLVRFEERMRIDGKPIPASALRRIGERILPFVYDHQSTFFEAATAIAFTWFAEEGIDIAVIETGLGGRLDATNVVTPLVSVITSIDREHTQVLGKDLRSIAREKAGIIKKGVPCVTGVQQDAVAEQLRKVCRVKRARFRRASEVALEVVESQWSGHVCDARIGRGKRLTGLRIPLGGDHQLLNASLALLAIDELRRTGQWKISEKAIHQGFEDLHRNSGIRARLMILQKKPLLIADVAHNPAAMRSLRIALEQLSKEPVILVFGVMKDKEVRRMAREIGSSVGHVYAVQPRTERARSASEVVRAFLREGVPAEIGGRVVEGLRKALRHPASHPVVITGSHFVVGEALAWLEGKEYLTINQ